MATSADVPEWMRNPPVYPGYAALNERRAREEASRKEWERRVGLWLRYQLAWIASGYPHFDAPAPVGIQKGWCWTNWTAFTDEQVLDVALVRSYGCRCDLPLVGHRTRCVDGVWVPTTPRCRLCNTDEDGRP